VAIFCWKKKHSILINKHVNFIFLSNSFSAKNSENAQNIHGGKETTYAFLNPLLLQEKKMQFEIN